MSLPKTPSAGVAAVPESDRDPDLFSPRHVQTFELDGIDFVSWSISSIERGKMPSSPNPGSKPSPEIHITFRSLRDGSIRSLTKSVEIARATPAAVLRAATRLLHVS